MHEVKTVLWALRSSGSECKTLASSDFVQRMTSGLISPGLLCEKGLEGSTKRDKSRNPIWWTTGDGEHRQIATCLQCKLRGECGGKIPCSRTSWEMQQDLQNTIYKSHASPPQSHMRGSREMTQ